MAARILHPVVLSGSVSAIAQRRTVTPDTKKLVNTAKEAMLIDSVTVTLQGASSYEVGGLIGLSLQVGRFKLMNAPVPVWCLTPNPRAMDYGSQQTADTAKSKRWDTYRWIFPKPLYVPPGEALIPTFSRETDAHLNDINIEVTYAGHVVERVPRPIVVDIPSAAVVTGTAGAVSSWEGVNAGLGNPFNVPLQVQRLIGRVRTPNLTTFYQDSTTVTGNGSGAGALTGGFLTDNGSGIMTRIRDSVGIDLVKEPIPFDVLFAGQSRMWPFERVLAPREYLSVFFRDVPADTNPMIAMLGTRQERL